MKILIVLKLEINADECMKLLFSTKNDVYKSFGLILNLWVFFFQIDLYYPFNEIADKIRDLNM